MQQFADLIRWIMTYSISGGFIHFIASFIVLVLIAGTIGHIGANIFRLVRVEVIITKPAEKASDE